MTRVIITGDLSSASTYVGFAKKEAKVLRRARIREGSSTKSKHITIPNTVDIEINSSLSGEQVKLRGRSSSGAVLICDPQMVVVGGARRRDGYNKYRGFVQKEGLTSVTTSLQINATAYRRVLARLYTNNQGIFIDAFLVRFLKVVPPAHRIYSIQKVGNEYLLISGAPLPVSLKDVDYSLTVRYLNTAASAPSSEISLSEKIKEYVDAQVEEAEEAGEGVSVEFDAIKPFTPYSDIEVWDYTKDSHVDSSSYTIRRNSIETATQLSNMYSEQSSRDFDYFYPRVFAQEFEKRNREAFTEAAGLNIDRIHPAQYILKARDTIIIPESDPFGGLKLELGVIKNIVLDTPEKSPLGSVDNLSKIGSKDYIKLSFSLEVNSEDSTDERPVFDVTVEPESVIENSPYFKKTENIFYKPQPLFIPERGYSEPYIISLDLAGRAMYSPKDGEVETDTGLTLDYTVFGYPTYLDGVLERFTPIFNPYLFGRAEEESFVPVNEVTIVQDAVYSGKWLPADENYGFVFIEGSLSNPEPVVNVDTYGVLRTYGNRIGLQDTEILDKFAATFSFGGANTGYSHRNDLLDVVTKTHTISPVRTQLEAEVDINSQGLPSNSYSISYRNTFSGTLNYSIFDDSTESDDSEDTIPEVCFGEPVKHISDAVQHVVSGDRDMLIGHGYTGKPLYPMSAQTRVLYPSTDINYSQTSTDYAQTTRSLFDRNPNDRLVALGQGPEREANQPGDVCDNMVPLPGDSGYMPPATPLYPTYVEQSEYGTSDDNPIEGLPNNQGFFITLEENGVAIIDNGVVGEDIPDQISYTYNAVTGKHSIQDDRGKLLKPNEDERSEVFRTLLGITDKTDIDTDMWDRVSPRKFELMAFSSGLVKPIGGFWGDKDNYPQSWQGLYYNRDLSDPRWFDGAYDNNPCRNEEADYAQFVQYKSGFKVYPFGSLRLERTPDNNYAFFNTGTDSQDGIHLLRTGEIEEDGVPFSCLTNSTTMEYCSNQLDLPEGTDRVPVDTIPRTVQNISIQFPYEYKYPKDNPRVDYVVDRRTMPGFMSEFNTDDFLVFTQLFSDESDFRVGFLVSPTGLCIAAVESDFYDEWATIQTRYRENVRMLELDDTIEDLQELRDSIADDQGTLATNTRILRNDLDIDDEILYNAIELGSYRYVIDFGVD